MEALLFGLAVAVGLTPEMLPMIVSSNLAKGAVAMARRKVVVKRLNAIQNFGAMDVLCTDKTGTLTQDKIILEHHVDVTGQPNADVLRLGWLNSYHQSGVKNLMDQAVVRSAGAEPAITNTAASYRKVDELPFDFVRRRLQWSSRARTEITCSSARARLRRCCRSLRTSEEAKISIRLGDVERKNLAAMARAYNEDGFRVLVVATRGFVASEAKTHYAIADEADLTIQGVPYFSRPAKGDGWTSNAALAEHGVKVKVLTGDNAVVSAKICREVGS